MEIHKDMYTLNHQKYQYVSELFHELEFIPYAVVKGEPLSLVAYGALGQRGFGDIDLIIPRDYLNTVEKILHSLQYETYKISRKDRILLLSYSHQLLEYKKTYNDEMEIEIDLNFDIFWGEYQGKRIDIESFLSDTIKTDIYGITINTLPPMKSFIHLIMHHYKDMNSIFLLATKKSINDKMFRDLYYLFCNIEHCISLPEFHQICSGYKIVPYVYYVLYYTSLLYDDEKLKKYVNAFYCSKGEELLNCYGLNEQERHIWSVDFNTRLHSEDLYSLIKNDLTNTDLEKINKNKILFLHL